MAGNLQYFSAQIAVYIAGFSTLIWMYHQFIKFWQYHRGVKKDNIEMMNKLIDELDGNRQDNIMIEDYFLFIFKRYVNAKEVIFLFNQSYRRSTIKFYAYGQRYLTYIGDKIEVKTIISNNWYYWSISLSLFFAFCMSPFVALWFYFYPLFDILLFDIGVIYLCVFFGFICFGLYNQILYARLFYEDVSQGLTP